MVRMISEEQYKEQANCFIDPNCLKLMNIWQIHYIVAIQCRQSEKNWADPSSPYCRNINALELPRVMIVTAKCSSNGTFIAQSLTESTAACVVAIFDKKKNFDHRLWCFILYMLQFLMKCSMHHHKEMEMVLCAIYYKKPWTKHKKVTFLNDYKSSLNASENFKKCVWLNLYLIQYISNNSKYPRCNTMSSCIKSK